jgi:hypothetical protein
MPKIIKFTLPARPVAPNVAGLATPNGNGWSRHHIVGRKYLQFLYKILEAYGFIVSGNLAECDNRVKKFATYDNTGPRDMDELATGWFWAPTNLFLGPNGDFRSFDPSSGVEQVKPKGFPQKRWDAVKLIPATLEAIGIDLNSLVKHQDGQEQTYTIPKNDDDIRVTLGKLLDALYAVATVNAYKYKDDEWAVVQDSELLAVQNSKQVSTQYQLALNKKLVKIDKSVENDVVTQQLTSVTLKAILIN